MAATVNYSQYTTEMAETQGTKKGDVGTTMASVYNLTYADVSLIKTEKFDPDVIRAILLNDNISTFDKKQVSQYFKKRTNGNEVEVRYTLTADIMKDGLGRLYGNSKRGPCLSKFARDIRNALAHKYYYDLDMVCAHPTILTKICENKAWQCQNLKHYVEDRDNTLKQVSKAYECSMSDAKQMVNKIMYLGKPDKHDTYRFLYDMHDEMTKIVDNMEKAYADTYKAMLKKYKKEKNEHELKVSCLSFVLTTEENKILLNMDKFLTDKGRSVDTLIYDGCLVRKKEGEDTLPDELLRGCEKYIKTMTDYDIKLKVKPLVSTLILEINKGPEVVDDDYACKVFCECMGDRIKIINGETWVFDEDTGIWTNNPMTLKAYVHRFKENLMFKVVTDAGITKHNYGGVKKNIDNMLTFVGNYADIQDSFFDKNIDTSIGKLLYLDGIYDFDTNEFTAGFNPNIVFKDRIGRPFRIIKDQKLLDEVHKILFEDPFFEEDAELVEFYKKVLALAIYGKYTLKMFMFVVGLGNSGKGVTVEAMSAAFGAFIGMFNGESMIYNKNNGADAAKRMSWLIDCAFKRMMISNEFQKHAAVDGNILKSITSGGDMIMARKNFQDEGYVINRAMPFSFVNDMPKIEPYDDAVDNRVVCIEYRKVFVADPDPDNKMFVKADPEVKNKFKTNDDYKDALQTIIFMAYQKYLKDGLMVPEAAKAAKKEWVQNENTLEAILSERFEFVKNERAVVPFSKIDKFLKERGVQMTKTKVGRELTKLGCGIKDMKVAGATVKYRTNMIEKI